MLAAGLLLASASAAARPGLAGYDRPYDNGNMNGLYKVWSQDGSNTADPFNNGFNTDYAAKGYEYFDVWAPEIATHYGEVFWTDQGATPIPKEIQDRFDGKVMAIMGYEQDQVMVTPVGQPGVNPKQDVSVPINWAYNHHYMAWMTGKHSTLKTVPITGDEDGYGDGWHGANTKQVAVDLPSAANRLFADVAETSQMFSEGNGGESRKSFHGYPEGYAQLIESPTTWHITPMQIDTRNRDCGVTPADIGKCTQFTPGPEPKQARYGRGIPKGTNYSGILECPCNEGYGGDPQYYPNAGTKVVVHSFTVLNNGSCASTQAVSTASACFSSVAGLGVNATSLLNRTVSDASAPAGCSVTTLANGTAVVTYNTAGSMACASTPTLAGQVGTDIGVTLAVELSKNSSSSTMARSAKGVWCPNNKLNVLATFPSGTKANPPTPASEEAALAKCEAYCEQNDKCQACSVDDEMTHGRGPLQWNAIPDCGSPLNHWNGAIPGDVSQKGAAGVAKITISGPAAGWFAVGFDAKVMSDSPYTIVVNSTSVWEQKIGTCGSEAEHCPGDALAKSIQVVSSTVSGDVRTVVVTRPWTGLTKNHYSFSENTPTVNFISAVGSSQVFAYHKAHTDATISLTNAVGVPTCVCDLGVMGQLCNATSHQCDTFTKNCVAPPDGSLLAQHNPTCNSGQYSGGLKCCHHGRTMLDLAEATVSAKGPVLRYHMKFRFWFQEYKPAPAGGTPSHYDLPRIYYQTEAHAGEYDIPPAFSLPGNPVVGYENWPLGKPTPGTICTGTCPNGPDCECVHEIRFNWTMSSTRLVYAGGHCHAPACISIELYALINNKTTLLCHQLPVYGSGDVLHDKYDEAGYLALPPCLWGDKNRTQGLEPGVWIPENTPMWSIKKNRNTVMGHFGEMASWQMRGVNFPLP